MYNLKLKRLVSLILCGTFMDCSVSYAMDKPKSASDSKKAIRYNENKGYGNKKNNIELNEKDEQKKSKKDIGEYKIAYYAVDAKTKKMVSIQGKGVKSCVTVNCNESDIENLRSKCAINYFFRTDLSKRMGYDFHKFFEFLGAYGKPKTVQWVWNDREAAKAILRIEGDFSTIISDFKNNNALNSDRGKDDNGNELGVGSINSPDGVESTRNFMSKKTNRPSNDSEKMNGIEKSNPNNTNQIKLNEGKTYSQEVKIRLRFIDVDKSKAALSSKPYSLTGTDSETLDKTIGYIGEYLKTGVNDNATLSSQLKGWLRERKERCVGPCSDIVSVKPGKITTDGVHLIKCRVRYPKIQVVCQLLASPATNVKFNISTDRCGTTVDHSQYSSPLLAMEKICRRGFFNKYTSYDKRNFGESLCTLSKLQGYVSDSDKPCDVSSNIVNLVETHNDNVDYSRQVNPTIAGKALSNLMSKIGRKGISKLRYGLYQIISTLHISNEIVAMDTPFGMTKVYRNFPKCVPYTRGRGGFQVAFDSMVYPTQKAVLEVIIDFLSRIPQTFKSSVDSTTKLQTISFPEEEWFTDLQRKVANLDLSDDQKQQMSLWLIDLLYYMPKTNKEFGSYALAYVKYLYNSLTGERK